jgi:hypothetical protein
VAAGEEFQCEQYGVQGRGGKSSGSQSMWGSDAAARSSQLHSVGGAWEGAWRGSVAGKAAAALALRERGW